MIGGPVYILRLRPEPGVDGMLALRAALRVYGMRCISVSETLQSNQPMPDDRSKQRIAQIAVHNGK